MNSEIQTHESKGKGIFELARRWSLIIIALGVSAMKSGSETGIEFLTWLGAAVILGGAFLWVYKRIHNLGLIAAIIGGSLAMLGSPVSNSVLFGNTLSAADKAPFLMWGIVLVALGMGGWFYLRFVRTK